MSTCFISKRTLQVEKQYEMFSGVNYLFKSLNQHLKRVLIRLALPLASHSLWGTSIDLSPSSRDCMFAWVYVILIFCICGCFKQLLFVDTCAILITIWSQNKGYFVLISISILLVYLSPFLYKGSILNQKTHKGVINPRQTLSLNVSQWICHLRT